MTSSMSPLSYVTNRFKPGYSWVMAVDDQVCNFCGTGVADPILRSSVSILEPFRYDTGLFPWTMNLAPAGGFQPQLSIATLTEVDLFQRGIGDPSGAGADNIWWVKSLPETDLFKTGAPVDRPYLYMIFGLVAEALKPFQRGVVGAPTASDPKLFPPFLRVTDNGGTYCDRIQDLTLNNVSLEIRFGDQGLSYRCGRAEFWPGWGNSHGAGNFHGGAFSVPGTYFPLTTRIFAGSLADVRQMTIQCKTGQASMIEQSASAPFTSPVAADGGANGTVYAPIRVLTIGCIVCVPQLEYCGIAPMSNDQLLSMWQAAGYGG